MIEKTPLCPRRVRKIAGSFAFIEHRFLKDGFWETLSHHELLLYLFLVLVADRNGLSYYGFDKICTFLEISTDEYLLARDALIQKDLIAFDGHLFQVLSLPQSPVVERPKPLCFIRFESPRGEQCQIDWGHFGSIAYGHNTNSHAKMILFPPGFFHYQVSGAI